MEEVIPLFGIAVLPSASGQRCTSLHAELNNQERLMGKSQGTSVSVCTGCLLKLDLDEDSGTLSRCCQRISVGILHRRHQQLCGLLYVLFTSNTRA